VVLSEGTTEKISSDTTGDLSRDPPTTTTLLQAHARPEKRAQLMGCVWGAGGGAKIFIFNRPSRLALGIALCWGLSVYSKNASSPENSNPSSSGDEERMCGALSHHLRLFV
jgi:hypothetical protein